MYNPYKIKIKLLCLISFLNYEIYFYLKVLNLLNL